MVLSPRFGMEIGEITVIMSGGRSKRDGVCHIKTDLVMLLIHEQENLLGGKFMDNLEDLQPPKASSAKNVLPGAVLSGLNPPRSYTSSISSRYSGRSGGSYALMALSG